MSFTAPPISIRNLAEIKRSAFEAGKIDIESIRPPEIDRYLNPPADTLFGLEYAFYLLGDIRGKTVLDLGCGTGENLVPLIKRGAHVLGMDISPELISLAEKRLREAHLKALISVGDAYHIQLPSESVDVVFSASLVHHLDIPLVRDEILRILVPGGILILKEPVRFSRTYDRVRKLWPAKGDISEYEHPLTRVEFKTISQGFFLEQVRYFRLPFVPLLSTTRAWTVSHWMIRHFPPLEHFATCVVSRLRKPQSGCGPVPHGVAHT